jgi:hypothetical protein
MILNYYSLCQPRFYKWHAVYIDAAEIIPVKIYERSLGKTYIALINH